MQYELPYPILFVVLPFLLGGFIINGFIIWLFTKKDIPLDKSYWMSLLSYIVVAIIGLFISLHNNTTQNLWNLIIYFGLAIFFEWLFLFAYFHKYTYTWFKSAIIAGISNTITFGAATYFLFHKTGLLTKYANLLKIQIENQGINI